MLVMLNSEATKTKTQSYKLGSNIKKTNNSWKKSGLIPKRYGITNSPTQKLEKYVLNLMPKNPEVL